MRSSYILAAILAVSFLGRAAVRFWITPADEIWDSGYTLFYKIARAIATEGRFYGEAEFYDTAVYLAPRTPLYPLFIAGTLKFGAHSGTIFILLQSLISTLTCLWIYKIAKKIANQTAALWAAFFCAFFPYSFIHDTALQETGLYSFFSSLAVLGLVTAYEKKTIKTFFLSGLLLGLAVLTRASHMVHSLFLVIFIFFWIKERRLLLTAALLAGLLICVSPWMLRNQRVVGTPSLTTETGAALTKGNHPYTFVHYPTRRLDESTALFKSRWTTRVEGDEASQNRWYTKWALNYMKDHPVQTLTGGLIKISVNFSGIFSPSKNTLYDSVYFLSYWLWTVLGILGMFALRRNVYTGIFLTLCFSQAAFSFLFWAHTSHRAFLDPLLAVLAGIGFSLILRPKSG